MLSVDVGRVLLTMENMVLQIRHFREHGDDVRRIRKQLIGEVCVMFEKAVVDVVYAWVPGQSLDNTDALANFIVRVRDVHGDFGERDVAYGLLFTWYRFFPEWALRIFRRFVGGVGCWSDVKYMCGYLRDGALDGKAGADAFRDAILDIMLQQLLEDHGAWERAMETYLENRRQFFGIGETYRSGAMGTGAMDGWKCPREPLMKRPCARKHVSLAAKWCPRESSKYGWVFELLVVRYRDGVSLGLRPSLLGDFSPLRKNPPGSPNKILRGREKRPPLTSELSRRLRQMVSRLSREVNYME